MGQRLYMVSFRFHGNRQGSVKVRAVCAEEAKCITHSWMVKNRGVVPYGITATKVDA